jgi:hypothetical protein
MEGIEARTGAGCQESTEAAMSKAKPQPESRIDPKFSKPNLPVRPPNYPPRSGTNFTEAVGKVVAFINYVDEPRDNQALEIRFTDGTLLSFDLLPKVRLRVDYMELLNGDLEMIRDYGILPEGDDEDGA